MKIGGSNLLFPGFTIIIMPAEAYLKFDSEGFGRLGNQDPGKPDV
ncbi:hypothetical protein [Salinimicrobium gaetbulicola]|uniref:Uncharacterized protein n=1 Tax=Salinimicrobium gaetbulicola TaxID=999702 RepID=A0ABW3IH75_9FLAO